MMALKLVINIKSLRELMIIARLAQPIYNIGKIRPNSALLVHRITNIALGYTNGVIVNGLKSFHNIGESVTKCRLTNV